MGAPIKYGGLSLEEIAEREGISIAAAHMILSRAMRKLRSQGRLLMTCKQLAEALERSRPHAEHTVRRTARRG